MKINFGKLNKAKSPAKLQQNSTKKGGTALYNTIKARMAALGLKSKDIIEIINKRYNEHVSGSGFSDAIRSSYKFPRQEQICDWVEKILTEKENEQKQ